MEIKSVHIENFGTFSNYTMTFSKGMQVIHGHNEDGKTTLMTFLNMMFYSKQGSPQSIEGNPRRKYTPWNGKPMEGAIEFCWEGINYHLSKQFGSTPGKDVTTLTNIDSSEVIPLDNQEVGTRFFGLDLSGFERSSFIGQMGSIGTGKGTDDISEKLLINLVDTGDQEVSGQEIITRMKNSQKELLRSHNRSGLVADHRNNLQMLEDERTTVLFQLQGQEEFQQELDQVEKKHRRLEELETKVLGYTATQQKKKLLGLKKSQEKLEELGELISTPLYTPENLQELVDNGKALLTEYQDGEKTLETLNTKGDQILIPISPLELESFTKEYNQLETAKFLHSNWTGDTLPLLESHRKEKDAHEALLSSFHQLGDELDKNKKEYSDFEGKNNTFKELSQEIEHKERILDRQKEQWQIQLKERENRLAESNQRLENTPKSAKNKLFLPFLIFGLLLSIASIGAFIVLNQLPLLFVGGIGLVFLAVALLVRSRGNPEHERAKVENEIIKEDFDHWKLSVSKEEEELVKIIHVLSRESKDLKEETPEIASLKEAVEQGGKELYDLKERIGKSEYILENKEAEIQKQTKILAEKAKATENLNLEEIFLFSSDEEQEKAITNLLEIKVATLEEAVSAAYASKNVSSFQEFQKNAMETDLSQDHNQRVEKIGEEQKNLEVDFIRTISLHTPITSVSQGKELLHQLDTRNKSYHQLVEMISLTRENLGLSPENMGDIHELIQEQHELSQSYGEESIDELEQELSALRQENLVDKMKELQQQIQTPSRNLEEIESELKTVSEETKHIEDYYTSLSIALEIMEDAQEEMRQSFGPTLNKKTSEIFSRLTHGKYDTIQVDKSYNITVKSGVHLRDWQYLSDGTIDQAYLSLRLAISSLISPEEGQLPLLLDDVLIQYDEERGDTALEFLQEYAEKNHIQILLFSCHQRMETMAISHNIPTFQLHSR